MTPKKKSKPAPPKRSVRKITDDLREVVTERGRAKDTVEEAEDLLERVRASKKKVDSLVLRLKRELDEALGGGL